MKYTAIIFDLDGVICFTDKYHYKAWKQLADRLGIYFDEEINNRLKGVSRMESLEVILERSEKKYTEEEKKAFANEKNEIYVKLLDDMRESDLSLEVKQTLEELKARGLRLAIGSSSRNTKKILSKIGLSDFFDAISDGTNITHSKPDPEVFSVDPGEALVVEDAAAGVRAAVAGGFDSVGLGDARMADGVTYKMESFSDILFICP